MNFIDLLACALGAAILLMLIFSVSGGQTAGISGGPRDFIMYSVSVNDPAAKLRLMIRSPQKKEYIISEPEEFSTDIFQKIKLDGAIIFFWGPVTKFNLEKNSLESSREYRIYSTFQDLGTWEIGVLYYQNEGLVESQKLTATDVERILASELIIQEKITSRETPLLGTQESTDTLKLGDYHNYSFLIK